MSRRKKNLFYKKKKNYKFLIVVFVIVLVLISIGYGVYNYYDYAMNEVTEVIDKVFSNNVINEEVNEVNEDFKDTDIMKNSNVTYAGSEYGIEAEKVLDIVNGEVIDDNKYVFLTFDDGPSPNTSKVLSVLREKNVKATFFILGQNIDNNKSLKEVVIQCIKDGNAIGNHTYSHEFNKIYPSNSVNTSAYLEEFNKNNELLKSILGEEFDTRVTRMPGGYLSRKYYNDPSLKEFDEVLNKNNIISIDWTALNGDAEGKNYSKKELLEYAKKSSEGQKQIVILMHDTYGKEKTVEMLPELIDYYKSNGYEFKTIMSTN